ncbi:MAG: hypothetical protein E7077_00195 [Bacteroidales bacterium]|nr:hypothetical protein [Bacteroidales bacterium]
MKGQIRISVEPEDIIEFLESNIDELTWQDKKYLLHMIANSMTTKAGWEICGEIEDMIERIK